MVLLIFFICSIMFANSRCFFNYVQRIMLRKCFIFQTLKATMFMWSDYSNKFFIYSRLSLSRNRRGPQKQFEISVLRHIRFVVHVLRKKQFEQPKDQSL